MDLAKARELAANQDWVELWRGRWWESEFADYMMEHIPFDASWRMMVASTVEKLKVHERFVSVYSSEWEVARPALCFDIGCLTTVGRDVPNFLRDAMEEKEKYIAGISKRSDARAAANYALGRLQRGKHSSWMFATAYASVPDYDVTSVIFNYLPKSEHSRAGDIISGVVVESPEIYANRRQVEIKRKYS